MFPEFLRIGNFVVYWYGIMVAAGVLTASLIFQKLAGKKGYKPELTSQIIFWAVLWGIVGGRALHVIVQFPYSYRNPFEIIFIRNGGLAAEGAIISGFIFLSIYSKIKNFNLPGTLDMLAVAIPLAQAMGRIGCFLNGCCYGKTTDFILGVRFPHLQMPAHPTQLYYAASHLFLFVLLIILYRRKLKEGMVFSSYIMGFALIRYLLDFLRGDLLTTRLGLYPTQVIAVFLFVMGGVWFLSAAQKPENAQTHGQEEKLPPGEGGEKDI